MEVIKTAIDGVVIIEPRIFEDARGYFFESFSQREFDEKVLPLLQTSAISPQTSLRFVQDNESKSSYGRGMNLSPVTHCHSDLQKADRNEILIEAIQYGAPLRQLSRLTGISYGVIQRINGKMKVGQ